MARIVATAAAKTLSPITLEVRHATQCIGIVTDIQNSLEANRQSSSTPTCKTSKLLRGESSGRSDITLDKVCTRCALLYVY